MKQWIFGYSLSRWLYFLLKLFKSSHLFEVKSMGYEPTHIQMQGKTINECTTGGIFDENMRETEFLKINHALVAQLKLKFDLEKAKINPIE